MEKMMRSSSYQLDYGNVIKNYLSSLISAYAEIIASSHMTPSKNQHNFIQILSSFLTTLCHLGEDSPLK